MQERRYDEKEVAQILSRAAANQAGATELASSDGVTLAELQRIAGEVGLDPANIQRAAGELDRQRQDRSGSGSSSVLLEQSISGELSEETWDQLVTELQAYTGSPGKSEVRGQTHEWRGGSDVERTMLTATTRNERTQLKVLSDASGTSAMIGVFGGIVGLFGSLVPLIVSAKHGFSMGAAMTVALMAFVALLVASSTRGLIQRNRNKLRSRVSGLMDRIVETAEAGVSQGASQLSLDSLSAASQPDKPNSDSLRKTLSS